MKKWVLPAIFCLHSLISLSFATALADIQEHPSCTYCGMDREKYARSRMVTEYDDGSKFGACSLHCVAVNLASNIDRTPKVISVGDYYGKQLIDAEKAFWVIGGRVPGVMTSNAKWAFEHKNEAERFIKENGGTPATFDEAMRTAYDDMYKDTQQIRERRKMKKSSNK